MRLDVFLSEQGLTKSRSKAAAYISQGKVTVDGKVIKKPSFDVTSQNQVILTDTEPFVSRAGLKLDHALNEFCVDVTGLTALDIGASTGGFTDCLLKKGAHHVFSLDVGKMQLDDSLRNRKEVTVMEEFNARYAKKEDFSRPIDIIVMDVSFISQGLIYPACGDILPRGGRMITLIKPQFEAGRENIGKGGIVKDRDKKLFSSILTSLSSQAEEQGFIFKKTTVSPIKGGDGNTEYLALFEKTERADES